MKMQPCPECGEPSVIDFQFPKCTQRQCKWYDQNIWVEWVMELPDDGDPPDIEDEPTEPKYPIRFLGKWGPPLDTDD